MTRLELHEKLIEVLGNSNVYFQAPSVLKYPCIVYKLANINDLKANNKDFWENKSYELTLMHKNPDNEIVDKLNKLPYCKFGRYFSSDNLHHYTFTIDLEYY